MSRDVGFFGTKAPTASEKARLEFLTNFTAGCRVLLNEGAHKPFIRAMLRDVIYHQWEHPELMKNPQRHYSSEARRLNLTTRSAMRKKLRRDHVIPLNIVIDRLLQPRSSVKKLLSERVSVRFITIEEDRELTRLGLSSKMPKNWDWDKGPICARYQEAKIKFDKPVIKR